MQTPKLARTSSTARRTSWAFGNEYANDAVPKFDMNVRRGMIFGVDAHDELPGPHDLRHVSSNPFALGSGAQLWARPYSRGIPFATNGDVNKGQCRRRNGRLVPG